MRKPLDFDQARTFVASVPPGNWTSYGDVAAAGGSPRAAQAVGSWLARHGDEVPGVYRLINVSGEVSPGWRPASADLPPDRGRVKARLETEGVRFDDRGRADPRQRWRYTSGKAD
jgi:alkylated DNA nucleotide flippase Atl1